MSEKEKDPQEVDIYTEYEPDYRVIATNYFWVGWTGLGDISIDFMIQNAAIPERMTHKLNDRNIGNEIEDKREPPGANILRRVQMGVLLNPDQALALSQLLQTQVENYKKTLNKGK